MSRTNKRMGTGGRAVMARVAKEKRARKDAKRARTKARREAEDAR